MYQHSSLSKTIQSCLKEKQQPFNALKILMLLNRLIYDSSLDYDKIFDFLEQLSINTSNEMEKMFNQKLLNPYVLYLKKRCQKNLHDLKQPVRSYTILNIINCGTCFADSILTFGRYYGKINLFFIDFNITLALDIRYLYNKMIKNIDSPQKQGIVCELQKVHQKMYLIFYNCYFYKFTTKLAPKWISTQNSSLKGQLQNNSKLFNKENKKKCKQSRDISWQTLQTQSLNRVEYNNSIVASRIQVLKSLEKIVERMQDV